MQKKKKYDDLAVLDELTKKDIKAFKVVIETFLKASSPKLGATFIRDLRKGVAYLYLTLRKAEKELKECRKESLPE